MYISIRFIVMVQVKKHDKLLQGIELNIWQNNFYLSWLLLDHLLWLQNNKTKINPDDIYVYIKISFRQFTWIQLAIFSNVIYLEKCYFSIICKMAYLSLLKTTLIIWFMHLQYWGLHLQYTINRMAGNLHILNHV